mmetsp:Transcript_23986/g.42508  ORF Transcript_23986/g.42508 Transcript_23986/m.42508 type:complete len:139 (-) Transcript_23986:2-418(-)
MEEGQGRSIFSRHKAAISQAKLEPVNSESFALQQESQVAVHERFFHKFFALKREADDSKNKKHDDTDSDSDDDDDDDESDLGDGAFAAVEEYAAMLEDSGANAGKSKKQVEWEEARSQSKNRCNSKKNNQKKGKRGKR